MNTKTITATELRTGDTFTYTGHEYTVEYVREQDGTVAVKPVGSQYEMDFYTDSPVELISRGDGRPAVRAVVAPMPIRRRRAPRDYNASLKIIDPKGVLRTINYSTEESMFAGIDRLEAKGWTVWTHC